MATGWLFNSLVRSRLRVREAWSAVDVQLQRRASLIPNLVETVKGYASYERETLGRVVAARAALTTASGPGAASRANAELNGSLASLFAVAEAYPELKANESYLQLQRDLQDTENKIAYARNYYNGAVEDFNIRTESLPSVFVARAFGFSRAEFFSANADARDAVTVALD